MVKNIVTHLSVLASLRLVFYSTLCTQRIMPMDVLTPIPCQIWLPQYQTCISIEAQLSNFNQQDCICNLNPASEII